MRHNSCVPLQQAGLLKRLQHNSGRKQNKKHPKQKTKDESSFAASCVSVVSRPRRGLSKVRKSAGNTLPTIPTRNALYVLVRYVRARHAVASRALAFEYICRCFFRAQYRHEITLHHIRMWTAEVGLTRRRENAIPSLERQLTT